MDVVKEFVARYHKEYDFYDQAARLAAQLLDTRLREVGIRAIVTSRAKVIGSLEAKVRARAVKKEYANTEVIFDDIVDLAGVRIALYFPGEMWRAENVIQTLFNIQETKIFSPEHSRVQQIGNSQYKKSFPGYKARHYRVQIKDSALNDTQQRYTKARVEIQVASVLMHAWAEVEHDLIYKPHQGELADEEHAILDELNGMVLVGELSLERLQKAGETRVATASRRFSNHYDLASYLISTFSPSKGDAVDEKGLGRIDILFEFLTELNLVIPSKLRSYIKNLHSDLEKRPLAEQLIDQLLAEDKTRYQVYEHIRASRPTPGDHAGITQDGPDADVQKEIGLFLKKWVALEQKIHEKAKAAGGHGGYPSRTALTRMGVTEDSTLNNFERIRRMRNDIVHGVSVYNTAALREAAARTDEIVKKL